MKRRDFVKQIVAGSTALALFPTPTATALDAAVRVSSSLGSFTPGTLEAVGYLGGRAAAQHTVRTPGVATQLDLSLDLSGRPFARDAKDAVFVYAALKDAHGTVVPDAWENVFFGSTGGVTVVGANPFSSEAGIAAIVVQAEAPARGAVYALSILRDGEQVRILSAATPAGGDVMPFEVRFTTDGSAPGPQSPRYTGPVAATGRVRAALFAAGRAVAQADTAAEKFKVQGSTAMVED